MKANYICMTKDSQNQRTGVLVGTVVSARFPKTVRVEVSTYKLHTKYRKKYRDTKSYLVHDENSACKVGDTVRFVAMRPRSKRKNFEIISD